MRSTVLIGLALAVSTSPLAWAETLPSPNMIVNKPANMEGAALTTSASSPAKRVAAPTPAAAPAAPSVPVASAPAPAFAAPAAESDSGAIPALPLEVMAAGDVRFINGGVGDEELDQLKATAANYSLQLRIVGSEGEYVGDVAIKIADAKGAVILSVADAGPFLYAALKPGNYVFEANHLGAVQAFKVTIDGKGAVKKTITVAG